jgi:hypothetical protein
VIEKAKQQRKQSVQLDAALEKRIRSYVLTATASSVAVLALAKPSRAEVVYTPANQSIWDNGGYLDLNNDGIVDFRFVPLRYSSHSTCAFAVFYGVYIIPTEGNGIRGGVLSASALPSSILVGRNPQKFGDARELMAGGDYVRFLCTSSRSPDVEIIGQFANTRNRYLGLQFSISGELHYGWARFNVTDNGGSVSAILTGYAYETTPGAPIFTGNEFGNELKESPQPLKQDAERPVIPHANPATLGRLAQGAQGLAKWRINTVKKLK